MNYRDYKKFAQGNYYHVYNRGNGKMEIFKNDDDCYFFLSRLKENLFPGSTTMGTIVRKSRNGYIRRNLPAGSFSVVSYCLMPNHFHFLIRQNSNVPVSQLVSRICTSYGKYFNKKYERVGSLFQDAFKAILIESDSYLLWLSAYIHQNPQVAGLVKNLEDYRWSSYLDYLGLRDEILCDKEVILAQFKDSKAYGSFVLASFEKIKARKDLKNYLLD